MKQAVNDYQEARVRLMKSFRKINYRIKKIDAGVLHHKYFEQKNLIMKELRKLDKTLRKIIRENEN